jgi:CubicO group peptidase (beta-lactamase class C family)
MRERSVVVVLAVVGMLVVAACSGSDDASNAGSSPAAPSSATDPSVTAAPASTATPTTATPTTAAPTTAPPTTAPRTYDFSGVSPIVQSFVDEHGLNGAGLIVVDRDDGVVHEDYWGDFDADRISLVASASKTITAGVLLHLADQGLLDMDAPVADAVEWGSGNPTITPAQLVSNSSGLLGLADPAPSYACQFLVAGALQECAATIFTTPDDDAEVLPPDTQFRYGGGQWQVAGGLAEAVSGKSWAELIDEIYIAPCDLDTLGYTNPFAQAEIGGAGLDYPTMFDGDVSRLAPSDNPSMEGGAYLTTGDYAKLLLMELRGGTCGDEQVLSQASLDRMQSDRIGEVYGGTTQTGSGYGMGWWVDKAAGRIFDPGAFGAVPWLDLEDGYGAYLVIEADATTGFVLASQLFDPVDAAVGAAR